MQRPSNLALITMCTLAVNTIAMVIAGIVMCIQRGFEMFGKNE